jgi:DNA binding domain, excisionase family
MRFSRDELYTLQELSELTGLSHRTLQRLVGSGGLPAVKLGRKVLIRGADLLDNLPVAREQKPKRRARAKPKP